MEQHIETPTVKFPALREAPRAMPIQQPERAGTAFFDLPSVWRLDDKIDWLIADMIPLKGVTLLTAASGTGKTWVAYAIGGAVAHGTPFLGREVKRRPVVYLDGENPGAVVKERLGDLGITETDAFEIWGGWCPDDVPGPGKERIVSCAKTHKPLFIWDSLVQFHDGDEQSATETRRFMKLFRVLANLGAPVLVLHNTGKSDGSQQYRGSSDIEASVDMAYLLTSSSKGEQLTRLTMTGFKSRIAPCKNFGLEFHSGQGFEAVEVPEGPHKPSIQSVVLKIITDSPGINGTEIVELAKAQHAGRNKVRAFLKTLPYKNGKGNGRHYFPLEPHGSV